jgi:hypothetical protein
VIWRDAIAAAGAVGASAVPGRDGQVRLVRVYGPRGDVVVLVRFTCQPSSSRTTKISGTPDVMVNGTDTARVPHGGTYSICAGSFSSLFLGSVVKTTLALPRLPLLWTVAVMFCWCRRGEGREKVMSSLVMDRSLAQLSDTGPHDRPVVASLYSFTWLAGPRRRTSRACRGQIPRADETRLLVIWPMGKP